MELALFVQGHPASTQDAKNRAEAILSELEAEMPAQQMETVQSRLRSRPLDAYVEDWVMQVSQT